MYPCVSTFLINKSSRKNDFENYWGGDRPPSPPLVSATGGEREKGWEEGKKGGRVKERKEGGKEGKKEERSKKGSKE